MGFPILEGDIRVPEELDWLYQRAVQDGLVGSPQNQRAVLEAGAPNAGARLLAAEQISAGDVVARAQALFHSLGLSALFIDERPLVNEARAMALALNGVQHLTVWPRIANVHTDFISLPGGLTWDGRNSRWLNLKCAVVRFTKNKLGAGIEQSVVFFEEGGQTKFVPCIACNRFETIDRVVREFLTPAEGVVEVVNGAVRESPALLLPPRTPGQPPVLDLVDAHHITGSERARLRPTARRAIMWMVARIICCWRMVTRSWRRSCVVAVPNTVPGGSSRRESRGAAGFSWRSGTGAASKRRISHDMRFAIYDIRKLSHTQESMWAPAGCPSKRCQNSFKMSPFALRRKCPLLVWLTFPSGRRRCRRA